VQLFVQALVFIFLFIPLEIILRYLLGRQSLGVGGRRGLPILVQFSRGFKTCLPCLRASHRQAAGRYRTGISNGIYLFDFLSFRCYSLFGKE